MTNVPFPERPQSGGAGWRLRELVLLDERVKEARRRHFGKDESGYAEFNVGLTLLRDAKQIASSEKGSVTALILFRASIRLLAYATAQRAGAGVEISGWSTICERVESALPGIALGSAEYLADDAELALGRLASADAERRLTQLRGKADALAEPLVLAATAIQRVNRARFARITMPIVLIVVLIAVAWAKLSSRTNLALGRPVSLSDSDWQYGVDPSGVVNGNRRDLGFHTSAKPNTSVTIDLGEVRSVSEVVVYNRLDCCSERVAPLVLQVSADDQQYRTVATNNSVFEKWNITLPGRPEGRFIRLLHPRAVPFHLAEVEVYP